MGFYRRTSEDLLYPNRIVYKLLSDYADGTLTLKKIIYRARVEEVGEEEGQLESDPPSPIRSIRARVYTHGIDATTPKDALVIFHPLLPPAITPSIQAGEHVYVMFEDEDNFSNGLWISKIPHYTNINLADPDLEQDASPPNSAQTFEGSSRNSAASSSPEILYGGTSLNSSEQKRIVKTFQTQINNFWENRKILHIGDSTVVTIYGDILGDILVNDFGARSYIKDGRTSWGVPHWLVGRYNGVPTSTNKIQGATILELAKIHNPDIILIHLGGNDWSRAESSEYRKKVTELYNSAKNIAQFVLWVGPIEIFEGSLASRQNINRIKNGRRKASNIIKNVTGERLFFDATTVPMESRGRKDGLHFANTSAGRTDATKLAKAVSKFPIERNIQ